MNTASIGAILLRAIATLLLAAAAWVLLGYLATAPLGAIFGWAGHPSIPAAPVAIYVAVYLIALPALCLFAAWKLVVWIGARVRNRTAQV